jgi:hypothetical protein
MNRPFILPSLWTWPRKYHSPFSWLHERPHYLVDLERTPYPDTPLDPSVFEPLPQNVQVPAAAVPTTSVQNLTNLIKRGKFRLADRIRSELESLKVPIPTHPIYEKAAARMLWSTSYVDDQLGAFCAWFSLIPHADGRTLRYDFPAIRSYLFKQMKVTDVQIITHFALIAASKGYTSNGIAQDVVPFVVRFTDPSFSALFLRNFLGQYPPSRRAVWLNKAIQGYYTSGRVTSAFELFKECVDQDIGLLPITCRVLRHYTKGMKGTEELKNLNLHSRHFARLRDLSVLPRTTPRHQTFGSHTVSLADQLRMIKRTMGTQNPLRTRDILAFITAYKATGRTTALQLLFSKAYRTKKIGTNEPCIHNFLLAEMLYYLRSKEYRLLLLTFLKNFHPSGVPVADIVSQVRLLKRERKKRERRAELDKHDVAEVTLRRKLYPTQRHTALVWQAIVYLCETPKELERLYELLLRESRRDAPTDPSLLVRPPSQSFDSAHFTPFIQAVVGINTFSPMDVIHHMLSLGVECEPDLYQLTTLGWKLASQGQVEDVMIILDRLEDSLPPPSSPTYRPPPPPKDVATTLPAPNVVTYAAIIDGFLASREYEAALEVKRRLSERLDYIPGINPIADAVLEDFDSRYTAWQQFVS